MNSYHKESINMFLLKYLAANTKVEKRMTKNLFCDSCLTIDLCKNDFLTKT